jgi:hypothetical protein
MILKGKYWLKIDNPEMHTLPYFDAGIDVNYSVTLDGVMYNLPIIRFSSGSSNWQVSYYNASGSYFPNGVSSVIAGYCNPPVGIIDYHSQEARLIDFGDEPQTVTMDTDVETMFNLLFIPLPSDEFVNESNLVQVTNNMLDLIYNTAMSEYEITKPTITRILNNTSGQKNLTADLSKYDIIFIRANAYTGWDPLCYAIPAKAILKDLTSFVVKVADNSKYTFWVMSASGLTYQSAATASKPGQLFQVYGLSYGEG